MRIIAVIFILVTFIACDNSGKIKVQNQVSNTELQEVVWGDVVLASSLYPGQTSNSKRILHSDKKLPEENPLQFVISKNGKTVYLITEQKYRLDKKGDILIVIDDDTDVREF